MKFNLDGIDIECSVEEFKELKKLQQMKKVEEIEPIESTVSEVEIEVSNGFEIETNELEEIENALKDDDKDEKLKPKTQKDTPQIRRIKGYSNCAWNDEEDNFIIKNFKYGYEYLSKCMPHRTSTSIKQRKSLLKRNGKLDKIDKNEVKEKNIKKSENDGRVVRGRFITKRRNYYMNTYNWSPEKALKQACVDWNSGSAPIGFSNTNTEIKKPKVTIKSEDLELPALYPLSDNGMLLLEKVITNITLTKKITYFDVKKLETEHNEEWTGWMWRQFIDDFITRSDKIAKAFNIENKFSHDKDEQGYDIIVYRDED